jgi:hypothetical protein
MYIGNFKAFDKLTAEQHLALAGGWINEIPAGTVAKDTSLPHDLVSAYYSVKDMMYYEENGSWPCEPTDK